MFPHSFNKGFDEWIEGFVLILLTIKPPLVLFRLNQNRKSVHL